LPPSIWTWSPVNEILILNLTERNLPVIFGSVNDPLLDYSQTAAWMPFSHNHTVLFLSSATPPLTFKELNKLPLFWFNSMIIWKISAV
jgi:hypothetical protein